MSTELQTTTFSEPLKPRFSEWSKVALSRQCAAVGLKNGEADEMAQRLERLWDACKMEGYDGQEKKITPPQKKRMRTTFE